MFPNEKKNSNIKLDKLMVEKFPVVANFFRYFMYFKVAYYSFIRVQEVYTTNAQI